MLNSAQQNVRWNLKYDHMIQRLSQALEKDLQGRGLLLRAREAVQNEALIDMFPLETGFDQTDHDVVGNEFTRLDSLFCLSAESCVVLNSLTSRSAWVPLPAPGGPISIRLTMFRPSQGRRVFGGENCHGRYLQSIALCLH